jgi:cation transport ATPase
MSPSDEIRILRQRNLDPATGRLQRHMLRWTVAASVVLVVAGQLVAWSRHEQGGDVRHVMSTLATFPSGQSLMTLGVLLGVATPILRSLLLAEWFRRRGERIMLAVSGLLVLIILSGLLLSH